MCAVLVRSRYFWLSARQGVIVPVRGVGAGTATATADGNCLHRSFFFVLFSIHDVRCLLVCVSAYQRSGTLCCSYAADAHRELRSARGPVPTLLLDILRNSGYESWLRCDAAHTCALTKEI